MSEPHNCRHCTFMVCSDANWCSKHEEVMSDMQIRVARKCPEWEWNLIDALTFDEWAAKDFVARWRAAEGNEQREANSFFL